MDEGVWVLFGYFSQSDTYMIGVWWAEDQRTNTIKVTCLKEIGLQLKTLSTTTYLILNTIGMNYVLS